MCGRFGDRRSTRWRHVALGAGSALGRVSQQTLHHILLSAVLRRCCRHFQCSAYCCFQVRRVVNHYLVPDERLQALDEVIQPALGAPLWQVEVELFKGLNEIMDGSGLLQLGELVVGCAARVPDVV